MSSFTQRLSASQKQSFGQTLSPQMQRTMHLIALCRDDLEREIAEICETNPLLADLPAWSRKTGHGSGLADWSASVAAPVGLLEHLQQQLALAQAPSHVKAGAALIIAHIAPNGRIEAEDWHALSQHPGIDDALALVQGFEPAGIGARSLSECFALQLDEQCRACPAWVALLDNLDALASEPARAMAKRCGVNEVELSRMIAHLRTLSPYPGHRFESAEKIEITPDLRAAQSESGEWVVALTWDPGASIASEPAYTNWQQDKGLNAPARAFLQDKHDEAEWLKRALKQRGQTLLRVARLAIAYQDRFLTDGAEFLAPLTMRDIAGKLDLHESTISRAVANKYILTPRGVISMRDFFSTAVKDDLDHAETSSAAIRARIGTMIEKESVPGAMSDSAISKALKQTGIHIARRSIAKHREQLGLGSARERARMASYAIAAE
ncbi:RNA polymerase factor sigma-54 [Maricaulis sp.]|uniref:RNA polymerase factor sigma-54 n=1 Tax=Maricaulis sp. TaxID=1486257 RepID=UPI002625597B|nr:RNA polymerase factor sigma-54 [Maricaulis sp.]